MYTYMTKEIKDHSIKSCHGHFTTPLHQAPVIDCEQLQWNATLLQPESFPVALFKPKL